MVRSLSRPPAPTPPASPVWRRRVGGAAVVAALAFAASGCGSQPERAEVLADVADEVIVPAYEQLAINAEALEQAAAELCRTPTEQTRLAASAALTETRADWSYLEAMWVGPVADRRSWAVIDWPIAADEIEALIADESTALEVDLLARRVGADQRGLQAVEYLLSADSDQSAAESMSLTEPRRCQYLTAITTVISDEADRLPNDWSASWEDGPPYRDSFTAEASTGIDTLVNDALFLLEAMGDAELGWALGRMDGAADVGRVDEGPAGLGANDLAQHLAGLRAAMVGPRPGGTEGAPRSGAGLSPLLGDDLTTRLMARFDEAELAVAELTGQPLTTAVIERPEDVSAARDAIKAIQTTIATEVVSVLGVTIGFSDADGDTGA